MLLPPPRFDLASEEEDDDDPTLPACVNADDRRALLEMIGRAAALRDIAAAPPSSEDALGFQKIR